MQERGHVFSDYDMEYYVNRLKQLKKLEQMLVIGILVNVAVILFAGWYGGIITFPLFPNLAWSMQLVLFMAMEE